MFPSCKKLRRSTQSCNEQKFFFLAICQDNAIMTVSNIGEEFFHNILSSRASAEVPC
jgi:hypothetical protein